ncbi:MAG: oligosaccharide flippase family protein [Candidatus Bathyarchaeota archaeon]|nr:MAG: oligosaccharide flippase family protein [Candidatus Bathyarchaeota archaeon]
MVETDSTRLVKGSAYLASQSIVTTLISAVALAFTARILTQVEMGVVVALTLVLGLAQVLTDLGFGAGLTKFAAEYRGKGVDFTAMSFGAFLAKTLMAGSAAILCVLVAPWLSGFLLKSGEYTFLFQLLGVNIVTFCYRFTVSSLLLGTNRIGDMAILNLVSTFIGKASGVVFLVFGSGLSGIIIGWISGELIYIIPSALIILRNKYVKAHPLGEVAHHLKTLARFSWPLFVSGVVLFAYTWFDQGLLLAYVSLDDVAVYNVAIRAFTVLSIIPVALGSVLFPYYSEQRGKDEKDKIVAGVYGSSRYTALLYTPLALGLMATANPALTFFAGEAYVGGEVVLSILCIFGGLYGFVASIGNLLLVYGMTPTALAINVASIVGGVVMLPVLLPSFGVVGMAVVKGVAMIMVLVLTVAVLRKRMPIMFDKEALWKSWTAATVMSMAVWLVEFLHFDPYLLPLYVAVGGVVYMFALRVLGAVNENDMMLVRRLVGKKAAVLVDVVEKILV